MPILESTIENALIQQLIEGESQWTYRPDINSEAKLWDNFREKLNQNNLAVLQGKLITDSEFEQIKGIMLDNSKTTYDAALWLAGEHGVAQITLEREDATLGKVTLMVINSREIAGGTSSYEVINQYWSTDINQIRRFDVTLLINGVPMIHVELKNNHHPYMDAFRQINDYCKDGQFRGLFGFVQMFVVSNEAGTRYIAADKSGNMSEEFLIRWVDEHNQPVENLKDFAKYVLNIPMAHEMVGKFAVLDSDRKRQILLRPYQVHAIEKVRQAAKESKSGYVWHTTGSGKTLTSYTVTKNLLDIPSVDKTLFLIDRRDLDRQTSDNFKSYAENDDIDVDDTNSTWDLERKLTSKARIAIVTTIQKLQNIIRKCTAENPKPGVERLKKILRSKRLAFVIDECHRTVSPQTKRAIENFFPISSLWFGFTGTPIFVENKRAAFGNLPQTTEELYGPCLHQYTIKEALADESVLGFQIHNLGRSIEELRKIPAEHRLLEEKEMKEMTAIELEDAVIKKCTESGVDIYGTKEHHNQVVQYICGPNSIGKMRLDSEPGDAFCALLTCSSIKQAQDYYKEFKAYKESGKVSERVKALLPDFPKVAITYTLGENGEGDQVNKKEMEASLA
ncbi:MAG: DEAD/DEAH box helicase family protein, partial [Burkholderiales bacterium]|nr:DEAD/DEAH box helicase family protein [Burkholderiales bacterium]